MPLSESLRRNDLRNAMVCAAAVVAAFLAVNPFVQMPFNDDWTYAFTVRELLRTGHMTYHCGESAAFITQAYSGAFIVKLFGFSFVALRLTLPWAAGSAALCYLLARQADLRPAQPFSPRSSWPFPRFSCPWQPRSCPTYRHCSPSCLPFTPLFFRSGRKRSRRLGVAGGRFHCRTYRRIEPANRLDRSSYLRRLRRLASAADRSILMASTVGVLASFLAALVSAQWFYAQPYVITEWSFTGNLKNGLSTWRYTQATWLSILLTALLLVFPAAIPAAWRSLKSTWRDRRRRRGAIAAAAALVIAAELFLWPDLAVEPWLGHVVSHRGALWGMELSPQRAAVGDDMAKPRFHGQVGPQEQFGGDDQCGGGGDAAAGAAAISPGGFQRPPRRWDCRRKNQQHRRQQNAKPRRLRISPGAQSVLQIAGETPLGDDEGWA